ncbi:hypothetical protein [Chroococcidiopsis sp. CCMEE 29]|uniref:restriction endonuclease-related protein n=1 Tax=Chroococcidiopsis sp. CCMEE 29 TaxID=155894 RepID=UPI0020214C2F|nr:hypothetical protein [Chroococcidiopsis sp. CCMEE 29]
MIAAIDIPAASMHFEDIRQWQGTADTFTLVMQRKVKQLSLLIEAPSLRTVRLWRSKQLLSQPKGQNFGFRQILEGLATALLLKKGWTLAAIAEILPAFENMTLEQQIIAEANGKNSAWLGAVDTPQLLLSQEYHQESAIAEEAIILLAQGILRQYDRILDRREIVRQDDGLPPELQSAICKLGRLYIESGQCDRAACVHDVLDRARSSLNDEKWGLEIFRQSSFRFSKVILIDPDLRVPTSDCSVVANVSGAFGEDNVIEHRLHALNCDATERLGVPRQHAAYTALRELFGRRSLIGERELLDYLRDNRLTPLQGTILEAFFDPVPDIWLIAGLAHRCAYCGTLLRPHPDQKRYPEGRCPIRQCNSKYPAKISERLDPKAEQLLIAKPQILTYWSGPAIDELAIFDEAKRFGLSAELYPESDLCDISIDEYAIGIDAKSYSSPVSLALRLNHSIGGLIHYRRRIIAVNDELVADNPSYLSTLRSLLDKKGDPATLEILPVSSVIQSLRSIKHAYQA